MSSHAVIATVASLVTCAFAVVAKVPTYRVAPVFLLPLIWLPYFLRRRLHLHPLHYALFAVAMLLHGLGAFGFYQRSVFGWSFDIYVHFYFAFAVALVLERFFRHALAVPTWAIGMLTLLSMMGLGALHEIMEYASFLMLGEERGMLKPSTSHPFDTQRDLLNNLLGTLTALAVMGVARAVRRRGSR
jgi:uncharacterized membrane protein YjdF